MGIYVEGFKEHKSSGDKQLITATISTDLALKMLVEHLGLEYAFENGKSVIQKKK